MKKLGFAGVVALAMAAVACGQPEAAEESSTLKVTGSVDTQRQALDNASAIAISSDGRTFSAYLQSNGKFSPKLPVGHTYRVIIANSTASGQLRPIGHLVNSTSNGKAEVIAVRKGGAMNLGTLRPAGTSSSSLRTTTCDCPSDKGSSPAPGDKGGDDGSYPDKGGDTGSYPDKGGDTGGKGSADDGTTPPSGKGGSASSKGEGDDYECKQNDSAKDRVCSSASDVELEADNAPGDKCATDDDDDVAPKPSASPCSTPDENADGKDDDSATPSKGGNDEEADAPPAKGGDSGGDKGGGGSCSSCSPTPPSSCTYSKECGVGSSCVASRCTPDSSSGGTPSK